MDLYTLDLFKPEEMKKVVIALPGSKKPLQEYFYIEVQHFGLHPLRSFGKLYGGLQGFRHEVFEALFDDLKTEGIQTYGLLFDHNGKLVFSFNTRFAAINEKEGRIEAPAMEDVASRMILKLKGDIHRLKGDLKAKAADLEVVERKLKEKEGKP